MIEISLLKAFSNRQNYYLYVHLLRPKLLATQSVILLKDFAKYFESNLNICNIDFNVFYPIFLNYHVDMDEKTLLQYKEIIKNINECDIRPVEELLKSFKQQLAYEEIHRKLDNNINITKLKNEIEYLEKEINNVQELQELKNPTLKEALVKTNRQNGLLWRLQCLRDHFNGGLIDGDLIVVGAYTETGKTSFLASELTYMAQQCKDDEYILWLNNEGPNEEILLRLHCAALNCTENDLRNHEEDATIRYIKKMKDNPNRILIIDASGYSVKDVDRLIKNKPPKLLIFDMLDNITNSNGYDRSSTDGRDRYDQLYQWARATAKNLPVMATTQLNRECHNVKYPPITNMRESGVNKQSAAKVILFIGAVEGEEFVRYLSTPKFKLSGRKGWRMQVKFDPDRSRFI